MRNNQEFIDFFFRRSAGGAVRNLQICLVLPRFDFRTIVLIRTVLFRNISLLRRCCRSYARHVVCGVCWKCYFEKLEIWEFPELHYGLHFLVYSTSPYRGDCTWNCFHIWQQLYGQYSPFLVSAEMWLWFTVFAHLFEFDELIRVVVFTDFTRESRGLCSWTDFRSSVGLSCPYDAVEPSDLITSRC